MRPVRINHLSLAFITAIALLAMILGLLMVNEINDLSDTLARQEQTAAHNELQDALRNLDAELSRIGTRLANWDETRQQLIVDDYYILWRDNRANDAGYLPANTDAIALYNKQGTILRPSRQDATMPTRLPGDGQPVFLASSRSIGDQDHIHVGYYLPVYADPQHNILLGSVGIKLDLIKALLHRHPFRYMDIARIQLDTDEMPVQRLTNLLPRLRYQTQPNQSLDILRDLYRSELLRMLLLVVLVFILASWLLQRFIVRPLQAISRQIDALQDTTDDRPLQTPGGYPLPITELDHICASFNNYQKRLAELHNNLEQSSRDFYQQARHDALTGIFNRRAMDEDWHNVEPAADGRACAFLLFDCDHFKAINDSYGHDVGDSVIKGIAHNISDSLRSGDHLYRLGGDEFAAFLRDTDRDTAEHIAERCLERVQSHNFRDYGLAEPLSISIGLAFCDAGSKLRNLSELQKQADLAMYAAKRPGSRKIVSYHPELGEVAPLVANHALNLVFSAIGHPGRFQMHYQPIIRLPDQQPDYVEALARIRMQGNRLLAAPEIFPIVRSRRLDTEFDLAVIGAVQLDLERGHLPPGQGVSINISAPGIVHAKVITALLALRTAEPERKLMIEITETALITQIATASNHLRTLREAGCLVALDDFGSGYSSLRYLSSMPVDLVKFDISMIRLLNDPDPRQRALTEKIATIVKDAGYAIVAEGIENIATLNKVQAIGFDYAQGFLFPDSQADANSNPQAPDHDNPAEATS